MCPAQMLQKRSRSFTQSAAPPAARVIRVSSQNAITCHFAGLAQSCIDRYLDYPLTYEFQIPRPSPRDFQIQTGCEGPRDFFVSDGGRIFSAHLRGYSAIGRESRKRRPRSPVLKIFEKKALARPLSSWSPVENAHSTLELVVLYEDLGDVCRIDLG